MNHHQKDLRHTPSNRRNEPTQDPKLLVRLDKGSGDFLRLGLDLDIILLLLLLNLIADSTTDDRMSETMAEGGFTIV